MTQSTQHMTYKAIIVFAATTLLLSTSQIAAGQTPPPTAKAASTAPARTTATPKGATPTPRNTARVTASATLSPTQAVPTPVPFGVDAGDVTDKDAPLIEQSAGTINILLLGTDASTDVKNARTDSIMIASINPDIPSVSLLSFPRDLVVRIPDVGDDRINTVYQRGYRNKYPGGGPSFLALTLRKNFGIQIDHYAHIDFQGFIKAIDRLNGVEVLAECELHDTFPDKEVPKGKSDLDVLPGRVTLSGKQALWFSRSRLSTTDFDRARRQQKVMRAVLKKARDGNLLQNAIGLYADFRAHLDTDIGIGDLPALVSIAQNLDDLQIKSRVITYGIVNAYTSPSGASLLVRTEKTLPYIREALTPPADNQIQVLPVVQVYNGSKRVDMEAVAAERLNWEGFSVIKTGKTETPDQKETQIIVYTTSSKGSPVPRLAKIFNVKPKNIIAQPNPMNPAAARVVLGANYNSCPATATQGLDVVLAPTATTTARPTKTP